MKKYIMMIILSFMFFNSFSKTAIRDTIKVKSVEEAINMSLDSLRRFLVKNKIIIQVEYWLDEKKIKLGRNEVIKPYYAGLNSYLSWWDRIKIRKEYPNLLRVWIYFENHRTYIVSCRVGIQPDGLYYSEDGWIFLLSD